MKATLLFTASLLGVLLSITIGQMFLPLWGWLPILVISTILLVFFIISIYTANKNNENTRFSELNSLLNNLSSQLEVKLDEYKNETLQELSTIYNSLINELSQKEEKILKDIEKSNRELTELLCKKEKAIDDFISKNKNEIVKELSAKTDDLKQLADASSKLLLQTSKNQSEVVLQRLAEVSQQAITIQEIIEKSTLELSTKSDGVIVNIEQSKGNIKEQLAMNEGKLIDAFNTKINEANTTLSESIETMKQSANSSSALLFQTTKEQGDVIQQKLGGISQQSTTLQELIENASIELADKADVVVENIEQSHNNIKEQISLNEEKIIDTFKTGINEANTIITGILDSMKQSADASSALLFQTTKEQGDVIQQKLSGISQQSTTLQKSVEKMTTELTEKSDVLIANIEQSHINMKELLDANERKLNNNIKETVSTIVGKIEEEKIDNSSNYNHILKAERDHYDSIKGELNHIENQNTEMSEIITNSISESDKASEIFVSEIKNQYDSINKNIASVQIKTENLEQTMSELAEVDIKKELIKSFETVISELRVELDNKVSDINNQILDAQISQESTTNELNKLQVLLRTVLKSSEEKNKKLLTQDEVQQNRTETIVDSETDNIVLNRYKDGELVKSTMKNPSGHIIYEIEYMSGRIARSRNYDTNGDLNLEQTFYDNGQVHFRNEFTKKGKTTTEFDLNGNHK